MCRTGARWRSSPTVSSRRRASNWQHNRWLRTDAIELIWTKMPLCKLVEELKEDRNRPKKNSSDSNTSLTLLLRRSNTSCGKLVGRSWMSDGSNVTKARGYGSREQTNSSEEWWIAATCSKSAATLCELRYRYPLEANSRTGKNVLLHGLCCWRSL